mmetsp:Transcript_2195/g.5192  ORF Transcript_2195/g.5192 Transcript_2195/m.5192 type:complete len:98 (+) Transcript_2195:386-679(+)
MSLDNRRHSIRRLEADHDLITYFYRSGANQFNFFFEKGCTPRVKKDKKLPMLQIRDVEKIMKFCYLRGDKSRWHQLLDLFYRLSHIPYIVWTRFIRL